MGLLVSHSAVQFIKPCNCYANDKKNCDDEAVDQSGKPGCEILQIVKCFHRLKQYIFLIKEHEKC